MKASMSAGKAPPSIMLVTKLMDGSPSGGRELLCKLNRDALRDIYGDRLYVLELGRTPIRGFRAAVDAFRGHIDGINASTLNAAFRHIETGKFGEVFIDGSNLGEFAKSVKSRFPAVQVHTFFHNVEAVFFWGSFKQSKTIHALAVTIANYLAERKSVRFSDKIICLSERDSHSLLKLYGRAATHVSPMAVQDKLPPDAPRPAVPPGEQFALFVGGVFYANRAGIAWFVERVAPRIDIKICIVGRGFEAFRDELALDGKVEVVGAVDSLADWYSNSRFVIAPIFDGSGMKTKVAEAMMFGKTVIGTPEAFSGYENIADRAGRVCSSADDFVAAINAASSSPLPTFDPELRALYERNYSYSAARTRLAEILS